MFSEETADRARIALRDLNQRIWTSFAAVVLLILFLANEVGESSLSVAQLHATAKLLVALFIGLITALFGARARPHITRLWAIKDETAQEFFAHATPVVASTSVNFLTAFLLALLSTDYHIAALGWSPLWDVLPVIFLGLVTIGLALASFRLSHRPQRVFTSFEKAFAKATPVAFFTPFVLFSLISARYAIGGIAGLLSTPPNWLSFGKLLAGGFALYAFEFWLGSLFTDRNLAKDRVYRLEHFHLHVSRGEITLSEAPRRYAEILEAGLPPEALLDAFQEPPPSDRQT